MLAIFLALRSQQVFITKANSHVMLFNFHYIVMHYPTWSDLYLSSLIKVQVILIKVQKNY